MNQNILKKRLIIAAAIIIGLVALYLITVSIGRTGKQQVTITVAPSIATVKIDGKIVKDRVVYVSKSEHTIEFSLENFEASTKKLTPGTNSITESLSPANEAGQQFLDENEQYQLEREAIGSAEFTKTSEKITQKYPWISKLPIEGRLFAVNYGEAVLTKHPEGEPAIALYVSTDDAAERRSAINYIAEELAINPASIEIVFEDFDNPFVKDAYHE